MADGMRRDWCELCLAARGESDPHGTGFAQSAPGAVVQQLIEALDEGERSWRQITRSPDFQNVA
jgi:hypothetical protein